MLVYTHDDWLAEGRKLFGEDRLRWKFICPSCGHVASVKEWKEAGASEGEVAFSCIGRHLGANGDNTFKRNGGPCNYAGGGLIGLNPVKVILSDGKSQLVFDFAKAG
jgi:hypothetical protein